MKLRVVRLQWDGQVGLRDSAKATREGFLEKGTGHKVQDVC